MASTVGVANAKRMLFLAKFLNTDNLAGCRFLAQFVAPEELEETVENFDTKLCSDTPLSIAVSKDFHEGTVHLTKNTKPLVRHLKHTAFEWKWFVSSGRLREPIAAPALILERGRGVG